MSASPILIEIMLACYYSPEPELQMGSSRWNSEAGRQARNWLREESLIDEAWKATERGQAWVTFICDTPLPEVRWVLPRPRKECA